MASFDLIASFVAAARVSSFAGAARELGLSASAVAKNVARLEADLRVRLFHRTTRQVRLTQDGEAIFERCHRILEDVEALGTVTSQASEALTGTLRIDVPVTYGKQIVLPVLARLMRRHPGLRVDVRFSDRFADLVKEGLDAAIRIGDMSDSGLVARRFDEQLIVTCASPAYLSRRDTPQTPDDLSRHDCIVFRLPSSGRDRRWGYRQSKRVVTFSPEAVMRLGDGEAMVQAAVTGLGITQVPAYMAEQALKRGRLVEVLSRYRPDPEPIALVYPSRQHVPARVRAFGDALVAERSPG